MPVRWFKGQYDDSVHVHRDGQDWNEEQMADYKGRTELIKDGIRVGNVSLIIHNVSSSDSGQYSCFLDAGDFYEKAVMELKVAALGSSPHVYLEDSADGGVQLVCRSSGWYPPPEVWWTDYQGKNLTSFSEVKPGDGSLLFNIKTTITANGNSSTFSCFIKNPTLTEWKQSTTHISDNFLQDLSNCSTERLLIMAACFLSLGTFLVPLLLFVRRKQGIAQCNKRLGELSKDLKHLPEERDWTRAKRFAVPVTLNPDTAHPQLALSENGKRVRWTKTPQTLPDNPERLTYYELVLGREGFTEGRGYWEMDVLQVGGIWMVGVAEESLNRKDAIPWSPEAGVWGVSGDDGKYWALTSPRWTPLNLREEPMKIGVYVDYEGKQLSVYNAGTVEHLYTFTDASFTARILPFFRIYNTDLRLV
ncbi:butyrophilin subfamily 1 member A1-like isoform X2 [Ambystoma mexicanum]